MTGCRSGSRRCSPSLPCWWPATSWSSSRPTPATSASLRTTAGPSHRPSSSLPSSSRSSSTRRRTPASRPPSPRRLQRSPTARPPRSVLQAPRAPRASLGRQVRRSPVHRAPQALREPQGRPGRRGHRSSDLPVPSALPARRAQPVPKVILGRLGGPERRVLLGPMALPVRKERRGMSDPPVLRVLLARRDRRVQQDPRHARRSASAPECAHERPGRPQDHPPDRTHPPRVRSHRPLRRPHAITAST